LVDVTTTQNYTDLWYWFAT